MGLIAPDDHLRAGGYKGRRRRERGAAHPTYCSLLQGKNPGIQVELCRLWEAV